MLRAKVDYRVHGPPAPRRIQPLALPEFSREHEVWCVDTPNTKVAALWIDGVLWLAGDAIYAGARSLAPGDEASPGGDQGMRWTKLVPEAGARYLALAGATRVPDQSNGDRQALLDRVLDIPPAPEPGKLARLLGKRARPVEAVALVVDIVDEPEPASLESWLATLQARGVDLSWMGNESGQGFVHAIRRPLAGESGIAAALLDHAREDPELTRLIREHVELWLEEGDEQPEIAGRLVPDDPTRGWIEELELDAIATDLDASAGAWLDPGTGHARPGWRYELPGPAILAALHRYLEQPTIVAVHSAPEESILAVHLIGGIDRATGDLAGFALQRVWT